MRLTPVPALALCAIALCAALTGCSGAGVDESAPTNSADDAAQRAAVQCPQQFLDATIGGVQPSETPETEPVVAEIDFSEFEPAALGAVMQGGCAIGFQFVHADGTTLYNEAYLPGGEGVVDELNAALMDDGFRWVSENQYVGFDGRFVVIYVNDLSFFSEEQLAGDGLEFLGDEFLVVSSYLDELN